MDIEVAFVVFELVAMGMGILLGRAMDRYERIDKGIHDRDSDSWVCCDGCAGMDKCICRHSDEFKGMEPEEKIARIYAMADKLHVKIGGKE